MKLEVAEPDQFPRAHAALAGFYYARERFDEAIPLLGTVVAIDPGNLKAVLNLGYSRADAERVLDDAAREAGSDATLETLVRASLKRLLR